MYKEIISIVIILIIVVSMELITENYTKDTVEYLNQKLEELRDDVSNINDKEKGKVDKNSNDDLQDEIQKIYDDWRNRYKKLSYYLEHDEIEKVEADLINIKSFIEVGDYNMTIEEIDSCKYILNHIEDKEKLNLSNIF